jgi:hypothetical protein
MQNNCCWGRIFVNKCASTLAQCCWLCKLRTPLWTPSEDDCADSLLAVVLAGSAVAVEVAAKMLGVGSPKQQKLQGGCLHILELGRCPCVATGINQLLFRSTKDIRFLTYITKISNKGIRYYGTILSIVPNWGASALKEVGGTHHGGSKPTTPHRTNRTKWKFRGGQSLYQWQLYSFYFFTHGKL